MKYNARHDAYYDEVADLWLENDCGDPECEFCVGRPEKPSMVKDEKIPEGIWHQ